MWVYSELSHVTAWTSLDGDNHLTKRFPREAVLLVHSTGMLSTSIGIYAAVVLTSSLYSVVQNETSCRTCALYLQ